MLKFMKNTNKEHKENKDENSAAGEKPELKTVLESLLFVRGEPMAIAKIAKLCNVKLANIEEALSDLSADYESRKSGLIVLRDGDRVQLATSPVAASFVAALVRADLHGSLSRALQEVLAIIAYRGPITRPSIEAIRGVNSSFALRALLMRGLITRANDPDDGRTHQYRISFDFLGKLGISRVEDLPEYEKLTQEKKVDDVILRSPEA
jgi:segregation and condensation protein B